MDETLIDIDQGTSGHVVEFPDAGARQAIETELDVNLAVVASAGTGKTEALIRRMVAAVMSGAADIDSLVAITFTRMAAGEMRARFAEKLREASVESDLARDALRKIDRCFVGTIHSFCARMLRERPLEAGIRADFTEVDEHEVAILWRHFWRDTVQQLYAEGDARIDALRRVGINVGELYEFFVTRSENSDLELKDGLSSEPDMNGPLEEVQEQIEIIRQRLGGDIPAQRDTFLEQLDRADHYRLHRPVEDAADQAELLRIYRRGFKKITQNKWPDARLAKDVSRVIAPDLLDRVIDPALTEWRQYVHGQIVPLIEDVVRRFASHRHERGLVTFHDLLVDTAVLLRTRPDVRQFFREKFSTFFVDEFQDTDPLQAEIIMYLSSGDLSPGDSSPGSWRRLVPDSGRLFVVGDEKQSIYRFRRADIDVFRLVRRQIERSGGRTVRLTTSFRSGDRLCKWLNHAFSKTFGEHEAEYQAEYDPLDSHISSATIAPVSRITIRKISQNPDAKVAEAEAHRIASFIATETAGRRSPGDFLILTRRRRFLNMYSRALESRGIPYDIVGGDSLSGSEELRSTLQMIETIRRPADEVAMLGYLRGPFVGLGDDELYAFRKAGGRFRRSGLLPADLPEELEERLRQAADQLDSARTDLMLLSPSAALRSILERSGLIAFSAGLEGGPTRAGNLIRVLSLVRSWEQQDLNWSEIIAELNLVIDDRFYQYEQMTLDVGRDDVVRIMNLHQAKGLQAPVVILADSSERNAPEPKQHVSRTEESEYLSIPILAQRGGRFNEVVAEPVGWENDKEREKRFAEAEELRCVYVAATRAKEQLVVCMYAGSEDRGPWHRLYPSLVDVPELTTEGDTSVEVQTDEVVDASGVMDEVHAYWRRAAVPTYTIATATGEDPAEAIEDFPTRGRGADYGTIFHDVIQALVDRRTDDIASYARSAAEDAGISRHADDLVQEVDMFKKSSLWAELKESPEVYSEVPFAYRLPNEDTVVRGTIDLVYRVPTGWAIVDFKTHRAESQEDIQKLQSRYAPQLRTYARAWQDITGENVTRTGLWLTSIGVDVPLEDL